jgi:D-arginine dehydrogenase
VIVIGAGMAGVSAAAVLAERLSVVVIERESQPAYHSTGRSAALFSAIYGGEAVRALSRGSQAFLYEPPAGFAEAPLVRRRGSLYIARADQAAAFEAFASPPDVAAAVRRLEPSEALALCPILRPDQAAFAALEPDSADVDVHALHQGYLRRLRAGGGRLLTDHAVEALERTPAGWRVRTGGTSFAAPVVVNAAGAWADVVADLAGARPIGLQPMRRTALLVDPPEGVRVDDWPMVIDVEETFYFKPDAGLLLLSPADETPSPPCDAQPEALDVAVAIDRVQTATTLEVRRVRHRWAGLRSFVADRAPVAGWDPEAAGFFWLAGQGGYGIQTAPAMARTAAALLQNEALPGDLVDAGVDPRALSPERLQRPVSTAARADAL